VGTDVTCTGVPMNTPVASQSLIQMKLGSLDIDNCDFYDADSKRIFELVTVPTTIINTEIERSTMVEQIF